MSDVEVTFKLPQELVERARTAGIEIEAVTPDIVKLIESRTVGVTVLRLYQIVELQHRRTIPTFLVPEGNN